MDGCEMGYGHGPVYLYERVPDLHPAVPVGLARFRVHYSSIAIRARARFGVLVYMYLNLDHGPGYWT